MSQRRHVSRGDIHCVLTKRDVTIATEIIDLYAVGSSAPIQSVKGHRRCEQLDLRICPTACVFISGGTGVGLDPRTGEQVSTANLDL